MFGRPGTTVGALLAVGMSFAGCSDGSARSADTTVVAVVTTTSVPAVSDVLSPPAIDDPPGAETVPAPPVGLDTVPPPPEPPVPPPVSDPPQTGVPGAGADVVCRSVGTLLVSEYLIGLIEAYGDEPSARRAEATAAPAILAAVGEVDAALASNGLVGDPFADRWAGLTARARTAVAAVDLDGVGVEARWLDLLATHDRNDPDVVLDLDPAQVAAVEQAAVAISAAHGPIATDIDYLESVLVATPVVDAHLAQRCPEVAALTVGDAV